MTQVDYSDPAWAQGLPKKKPRPFAYGYRDKTGFLYPVVAGRPLEDESYDNLEPITDKDEWERLLAENSKPKDPSEFTAAEDYAESEQRIADENEEREETKGVGKAAEKAMKATNAEGRTTKDRKPAAPPPPPAAVMPDLTDLGD